MYPFINTTCNTCNDSLPCTCQNTYKYIYKDIYKDICNDSCKELLLTTNFITYQGPDLNYIDTKNCDTLSVVLQKINESIFNNTVIITNSIIVSALGYTPANDANVVHLTGDETINGLKMFQGTIASDSASVGDELLTTGYGTNWFGTNFLTGYTHIVGEFDSLTSYLSAEPGIKYQIKYEMTNTAGEVYLQFGGFSTTLLATGATSCIAINNNTLILEASDEFDGSISISVKMVGTSSATTIFLTSNGIVSNEIRASNIISNYFSGINSGKSNTTGYDNTAVGQNALVNSITGYDNTAIGSNALNSNISGLNNTALGKFSLKNNVYGNNNTAVGQDSLQNNLSDNNSAFGQGSLNANTFGYGNSAFGQDSLSNNTTGSSNTAIGCRSMLFNTTGGYNTTVGIGSLQANTIGTGNSALGQGALNSNTTGAENTAIGNVSMLKNTTGSKNTTIGSGSGKTTADKISFVTILNNSTMIGNDTSPFANNQTNQIVIGYDATGAGSNTATLGNPYITKTVLRGEVSGGAFKTNGGLSSQYVKGDGSLSSTIPDSRPYKVYTALLTQTGTSAPTSTVLENTLGDTPTISYLGVGLFKVSFTSLLDLGNASKLWYSITQRNDTHHVYLNYGGSVGAGGFIVSSRNNSNVYTNSVLNNNPIEIKVYN
jgi:hypothetical protein